MKEYDGDFVEQREDDFENAEDAMSDDFENAEDAMSDDDC
jgi:hypothetical protein